MATNRLIALPKFSYTNLDFDSIIEDVKKLIKESPEYNQMWDDYLESNSGRMFTEIMSFIIEKLASRVDWVVQEMFISTATQRQSLIDLLKLINHRPDLPIAAKVNVKVKLTKWAEPFVLPVRETIIGLDTEGNPLKFELIDMASDRKPDYNYQYTVQSGDINNKITEIFNVPFYEGTTYFEDDIYMDGIDNEKVELQTYPVIENSVRVFNVEDNIEYTEVESFISPEAQDPDVVPYIVSIDADNKVTVVFGPASLVKIPLKGERIKIMYRIGGGSKTNIVSNSINATKTYTMDDNKRITLIYNNPNPGFGGSNEESLEEARLTAPLSLRSANKTVTYEDYISHLELCPLVKHAQVIGKENEPDEFYSEYGYSFPPLDTWIYIVPEREDISTINPLHYCKQLQIGKPYTIHSIIDSEIITFTSTNQKIWLKNWRENAGYTIYITMANNIIANSYQQNIDYTFDSIDGSLTRIPTSEGGTIGPGDQTLLVRYIYDDTTSGFKTNTVYTFVNDEIQIPVFNNALYPNYPIIVTKADGTIYTETDDYEILWSENKIIRNSNIGGSISPGETVSVYYASGWDPESDSEESTILDYIADKKMICVDNYIKDSRFTTFDLAATIYCYKNMRSKIESGLKDFLREIYSIENRLFMEDVNKSIITNDIMRFDGVKGLDVTYLGKNYDAYQRYVLGNLTLNELNNMGANKVEHKITAQYNEVIVVANDIWDSPTHIVENQKNGFIFTFKDI